MSTAALRLSRRKVLAIAAGGAAGAAGIRLLTLLPGGSGTAPVASASAAGPDGSWASPLGSPRGLAAHLLRRAGFGYTDSELEAAAGMPYASLVEQVLNQEPDALPPVTDSTNYQQVVRAWYAHMASTASQFPERMTLFWHGVLTSDFRKAARLPFVLQQNQLYRAQGRSDLRSLLVATTYDPLMIRYLDLEESTAAAPNENYSRELMELFTLGAGNYTETDVREGARIFSGIRGLLFDPGGAPARMPKTKGMTPQQIYAAIDQLLAQGYTFKGTLVPRLHDGGSKTYLGHTGKIEPEEAIDIILSQPSCAPHIAQRALVQFCTPSPSNDLVNSVATQFRSARYDIRTLMRAIFTSEEFTSAVNYRSLVRQPADYMVAAMRALGRPDLAALCVRSGTGMGQVLYDMPTVAGWPSNQGWISSSAWLARLNLAAAATSTRRTLPSPATALLHQLDGVVGADTHAVYTAAHSDADRWYALLSSPEFQLK